jgi:hypothetical protein
LKVVDLYDIRLDISSLPHLGTCSGERADEAPRWFVQIMLEDGDEPDAEPIQIGTMEFLMVDEAMDLPGRVRALAAGRTTRAVAGGHRVWTAVTANRSTACRCPPVKATTVRTGSVAPVKATFVDHAVPVPPAGLWPLCPSGIAAEGWRTCTLMSSSTPVMMPPTVTGEATRAP